MLKGKTIVITGATSGIGEAIARVCAREGARAVIGYRRNETAARALAEELGGVARYLDVRAPDSIAAACEPFLEGQIQGWVNNAAIHLPGLLPTVSDAMIEEQIETNLLGPIRCCRFILPHMMEHRQGSIVNIGSVTRERVHPGQAVYAATKGGVAALTRALACEYARMGIRVSCVEPGPEDTAMLEEGRKRAGARLTESIPMRRIGAPSEIAELVAFLLSDRASYMTGGLYSADGGYSL